MDLLPNAGETMLAACDITRGATEFDALHGAAQCDHRDNAVNLSKHIKGHRVEQKTIQATDLSPPVERRMHQSKHRSYCSFNSSKGTMSRCSLGQSRGGRKNQ
jgi:hypothetical protein